MLTSRQLAIVVWLAIIAAIILIVAMKNRDIRSSVLAVLRSLVSPKLLLLLNTIIAYNVAVIWCLWRLGYWDASMAYDTVVFVAVGGIGSVSRAATRGITYDWRLYLKTILVNLELTILLVFLSDFFSFNFWLELLVVTPLTTFVVMLVVASAYQKGAEQTHRFLVGVQAAIGLLLIAYVVVRAIADYQQLLHLQVLYAVSLPFVMSVLFVPMLLLICAVFAYEDAFLVIELKTDNDERLARRKKRMLFRRFGLNLKALQAFRRSSAMQEYAWVKTEEEAARCLV